MASFGEVLQDFKSREEVENVMAILDNKDLQNGLLAWKSVRITFMKAEDCPFKDPHEQWDWMWSRIQYDVRAFGNIAGVSGKDVGGLLERLAGLRLIYPDGTINKTAATYLQAVIKVKLNSILKSSAKTTK
jgi:hypothetical protein